MTGKSGHTLRLIEHLVYLKFPGLELADQTLAEDPEMLAELQKDVEAYRAELSGLSEDDLEATTEMAETAARLAEEQFSSSQEELKRFFHLPASTADYRPWGMMATWTLDQATALILGKEPAVVTWERVNELVDVSIFAREYARLRAFLQAETLDFPISPQEFVAWSTRRGFRLPDELIASVQQREEDPIRTDKPSSAASPLVKSGRPPSTREAVREAILENCGNNVPQRATQNLQRAVAKSFKNKGLPEASPTTVRRALQDLRAEKKRQN